MQDGTKIESLMNERDIMRMISGQPTDKHAPTPHGTFPLTLNRLITTTKDQEHLCLVVEEARGIDLV